MPRHRKKEPQARDGSLASSPLSPAETDPSRGQPVDKGLLGDLVFTMLAKSTLVGFCMIQSGRFAYVNDRLADVLGYVPAEMTGRRVLDFLDPESETKLGCWSESGERQAKIA